MKKLISLIKVSLNHDMNIFKINSKKQSKLVRYGLPIFFAVYIMALLAGYATKLTDMLRPLHMEFVVLTLFGLSVSILTLFEGIYKSSSLLFKCKDDNLMLSLPIKKTTVLFVRFFKFYVFELLYNSLFLIPAIIVYAVNTVPSWTFYLTSTVALFVLPIVPIAISCILGFIITSLSSMFKGKNAFQTIFSIVFILFIMYVTFNTEKFANNIVNTATSINDLITKLYYPVGAYISLVNEFNISQFIVYVFSHIFIFVITVYILGRVYFKINSNFKKVLVSHKNSKYTIKSSSQMKAIVKKELNRFFSTPVFVINAGFGLIIFIIACVLCSIKFDSIVTSVVKVNTELSIDSIKSMLPVIMFGMICFTSFMTSITSSMISLEGKTFSLLKSFPITPIKIVLYKVLAAILIMIPCIIVGDIIVFIRFSFDITSIILILIASVLLPLVSGLIGIIVNLKYPKIDATNDTEVVKQSMSALIATFIGLALVGINIVLIAVMLDAGISNNLIMLSLTCFYSIICGVLYLLLKKNCTKNFNNIVA